MKVNIALFVCCIIAIFYAYTKHVQAGEAKPNDTLVVHDTTWKRYDSLIAQAEELESRQVGVPMLLNGF
jgi:hypothetical protein